MNVDAWSSSTLSACLSVVEGCMESIPVHFAWLRDLYRSAAVTFTIYAQLHRMPLRQRGLIKHPKHGLQCQCW